jgi:hypothetical protein
LAAEASSSGSSGGNRGWSQQHLQHRICVKKKAGSLSYTDDHTGVKSMLFKAFYAGGSDDILAAAAGGGSDDAAAAGDDEGDVSQETASSKGAQQEQRQQHSFDITHLCQTFAADPQIQAFAQVLQAANAAAAAAAGGKRSKASSRFLSFCNGALYECVVQEKTGTLPAYLQLHALVQQVCALALVAGQPADAAGDGSGSNRMRRLLLGASSSGGSGGSGGSAALGCLAPVGAGLLLQDLMLVLHHYGSSMAVAAGVCRTAQLRGAQGAAGGSMQQRELAEVDMLMWQPLLQPGFCTSLFTTLMQFWREAGVLPQELGHSSYASSADRGDSVSGAGACSMLSRYITAGSIRAAAETTQAAGTGDRQCVRLQQEREQLLAGCLAALQLPAAVQLQELRASLSDQHQQSMQGEGELKAQAAAAVLALLTGPQGCAAVQDVPARSLMVLAAALREVLLARL